MSESLKIERKFGHSVASVYDAWTNPEVFPLWMGPGNVKCIKFESNLKVGGEYEIHMQTDDGIKIAYGEYKEIKVNERLSFTWGWKGSDLEGSLVELTFCGSESEMTLTLEHKGLPTKESAEHHNLGWSSSLEKLMAFLND